MSILNKTDRASASIFACVNWLSTNRTDLSKYLLDATTMVLEEDDLVRVNLAVNGPNGYIDFTFEVNIETEEVTLKSENR